MAEIANPHRSRTICMAVTAPGDERGSPTLWSASIDQISSGQLDGQKRLICLAAGNIRENAGNDYPDQNQTSVMEAPAQAWNAITVGAYTDLGCANRLDQRRPSAFRLRHLTRFPLARCSCSLLRTSAQPAFALEGTRQAVLAKTYPRDARDGRSRRGVLRAFFPCLSKYGSGGWSSKNLMPILLATDEAKFLGRVGFE